MLNSRPLAALKNLTCLNLRENYIGDLDEIFSTLRPMSQSLTELDLRSNPIQRVPKYRDHIILLAYKLGKEYPLALTVVEILDDKKILSSERKYLYNVFQNREKLTTRKFTLSNDSKQLLSMIGSPSVLSPTVSQSKLSPQRFAAAHHRAESQFMPGEIKIDQHEFTLANKGMKGLLVRAKLSPMRSRVVMQ